MIRGTLSLCAGLACLLAVASPARASVVSNVYGEVITASDLSGSRSVGNGLVTSGAWATGGLNWSIQYDASDQSYTYEYTFTGLGKPAASHVVMSISSNAVSDSGNLTASRALFDVTVDGQAVGSGDLEFTRGGFPHETEFTGGFKVEDLPDSDGFTLEFRSERQPVWGHFAIKGGKDKTTGRGKNASFAYLRNAAYGSSNVDLGNSLYYIPRPNGIAGETPVPSPGSAIAGLMMLGLAALRRPGLVLQAVRC